MRRIKPGIVFISAVTALMMCGCGKSECSMKLGIKWESHSAWTENTQGERHEKYTVSVGDSFYELENGRLSDTLPTDAESGEYGVLFEIASIDRNGVTVKANDGGETKLGYGEEYRISSLYNAPYCGTDFYYTVVFEK